MTKTPPEPEEKQWPLGEPIARSVPARPEWRPLPGSPGIEVGPDGKLRTNLPLPPTNYGWMYQP